MSVASTKDLITLAATCGRELAEHGFSIVHSFLTDDEVAAGREAFARLAPTPEEYMTLGTRRYALMHRPPAGTFGAATMWQWPSWDDDVLVDQITSPKLISFVKQILGTDDLRLGPFALLLSAKYGGREGEPPVRHEGTNETILHMDRIGLVYPQLDGVRRNIRCWIYYSDIDDDCGPLCVLSRQHVKGLPLDVMGLRRAEHPDLYERMVKATGPAGTMVVWVNPGVFHGGGPLGPAPAHRWVAGSDFQAAGTDWTGFSPLRPQTNHPHRSQQALTRYLARATLEQRALFGFPAPGDAYWDERTIAGTAAEYPGMDMTPYADALKR